MHFQFNIALLVSFLATFAFAAPASDSALSSLSKRGLPDHCVYISTTAVQCTPPPGADPSAMPEITSNLPDNCSPEKDNPKHIVCHVPGEPASFTTPTKRAVAAKDSAYSLIIIWKNNAAAKTKMAKRAVAAKDSAYSLIIIWKNSAAAKTKMAKRAVAAKDSSYLLVIKW